MSNHNTVLDEVSQSVDTNNLYSSASISEVLDCENSAGSETKSPVTDDPQQTSNDSTGQNETELTELSSDDAPEDAATEEPAVANDLQVSGEPDTSMSKALELITALTAQIEALKLKKTTRVASGSKPRPNVIYTLLSAPPSWHATPQVAQLQRILFQPDFLAEHKQSDGKVRVNEPTLFAQIERGAKSGMLRTKQPPVRIFQYYRNDLLKSNCLLWE